MHKASPSSSLPDVMTERETAEFLRVSARTVFTLEKSGRLACIRIGQRKLYRRSTVEKFLIDAESTPQST